MSLPRRKHWLCSCLDGLVCLDIVAATSPILIAARFAWVVIVAAQILAVSQLWNFEFDREYLVSVGYPDVTLSWPVGQNFSPAIWVVIFLIVAALPNLLPVKWYGRIEYFFGCVKITFLVGLVLFNMILHARKLVPQSSEFWTYDQPYSFIAQNYTLQEDPTRQESNIVVTGSLGQLAGVWSAMTTIIFSVIGFDTVAVTAAENRDLQRNESLKIAARKISMRITILYSLACFVVGLNVPYTDENLRDFTFSSIKSGEHSAFILAAVRNHLRGWPSFFNGFFIFSAAVAAMNALYCASRTLHALACVQEAWPWWAESIRWRLARTTAGVPMGAVLTSWFFGLIAFLSVNQYPSQVRHKRFKTLFNSPLSTDRHRFSARSRQTLLYRC